MEGQVSVPISWVSGIIGTLGTVIGVMAREFFKLQNKRVEETRSDTERLVQALSDNTSALHRITDALETSGSK